MLQSTDHQFSGTLLAVVGVEKADRVVCQAPGCGHGVYRRIHVVRHDNGSLGVYGSDCFGRLFEHLVERTPRYGSGEGRELTSEERRMLAENTESLIAEFEAEHQALLERARLRQEQQAALEQARLHQEQQAKVEQAARQRALPLRAQAVQLQPPTAEELARVEQRAKAIVRQKHGVDPDLPGWRGLVLLASKELLGR